jgi:hypothetical protein
MASTTTGTETKHRCLGCRRPIRSAASIATGYGAGCRAKFRKTARTADLSAWTAQQIADARQAIEDGAVVPSTREGVFHVVSSDGAEVHMTHANGCNCENGLQTRPLRPCYHRCAVAIVLAPSASAIVRPVTPAPLPALEPVQSDDDIWARLEAMDALELVPAF